MSESKLTIGEYYKEFVSIVGLIPGLISALPLANFLPNVSVFPPLGMAIQDFAIFGTVVVGVLMTLPIYILKDVIFFNLKWVRFAVLIGCVVLTVLLIVIHMHFRSEFIRTVTWAGKDVAVNVTVGKVLTPTAESTYKGLSDETMLQKSGAADEAIRKVYTKESLDAAHTWLYVSFVSPVLVAVACGSLVVLFIALDKNGARPT